MTSKNDTVADIVKRVRRDCNSYPLPTAAAEMLKLVREMYVAHQREVAELRECLKETMVIAIAEYHHHSCFKHVKCGEIERCKTCKVIRWRKALQDEGGEK